MIIPPPRISTRLRRGVGLSQEQIDKINRECDKESWQIVIVVSLILFAGVVGMGLMLHYLPSVVLK